MKKIFILTGVLYLVLASFSYAQSPFLTYKFVNPLIIPGSPDTLMFDVQAKSDVAGTYHTELSVYLNYNSDAFGVNVAANGKIILVRSGLTAEEAVPGSGFFKYNFLPLTDNANNRVVFGTEPAFGYNSLGFLTQVPTTFTPYVKVKLVIADESETAGINFAEDLMNGNQLYLTSPGLPLLYGTCVFDNNLNNLPLNPSTQLILSEIADPSNSSANFVEIYNAGATAIDFDAYYSWFLNINGNSSVQLTGSIAAGGKYVVANNAADFGTAYPGKNYNMVSSLVGTSGTTNYLLTIYGNYAGGVSIDAYNGSASGFNFSGKHAVRQYVIVTPSATPVLSEWVISSAENVDMTPGSHRATLTWDGSESDDWRLPANWAQEYIPDAAHNAAIPDQGEILPTIGTGETAYCYNLSFGGAGTDSDQADEFNEWFQEYGLKISQAFKKSFEK